jgi:hypothetical protein
VNSRSSRISSSSSERKILLNTTNKKNKIFSQIQKAIKGNKFINKTEFSHFAIQSVYILAYCLRQILKRYHYLSSLFEKRLAPLANVEIIYIQLF